jgi:hypothetical protein
VRGKVARELRKAAEFKPNAKRSYENWELSRIGLVLSFDEDGKVSYQEQEVPCYITECVSPERNLYQYFKRKYMDFGYEQQLNVLPSQGETRKLERDIISGLAEEAKKAKEESEGEDNTNE